jgi:uncharacterized DUF497 family protein
MNINYSEEKNQQNIEKHSISFERIDDFQWEYSLTEQDRRKNYDEPRFISYGFIYHRLHVLVWTLREYKMRPISLRKANSREERKYYERMGTRD